MEVGGVVVSGTGLATKWQESDGAVWVEELRRSMGWASIQIGSLNVKADPFRWLHNRDLPIRAQIRFRKETRPCCIVKFLGDDVAEIMAPMHLRDSLGLKDGDRVEVSFQ